MKITRKDGIVYERNKKELNYTSALNCRCMPETAEKFKKIAADKGIKYGVLLRNLAEDYVKYIEHLGNELKEGEK